MPGPYGPYARTSAAGPPRSIGLSHSQVSAKWEILMAHARRVEIARQRVFTVPITPVYDILPGGPQAIPVHVWDVINAVHRAHRALCAAQQHLQVAEAQLLTQMLYYYGPVHRRGIHEFGPRTPSPSPPPSPLPYH